MLFNECKKNIANMSLQKPKGTILVIEPFYGGSHKQLIDTLQQYFSDPSRYMQIDLYTLPAKKWHWRARTSALYFSEIIPRNESYTILFCSDVLNLTELIGLRQDLSSLLKIIYFHENQLVYPVQEVKERDFQYGYNQTLSALSADIVIFNSKFNMKTFLDNINSHFKLQPDFRPAGLKDRISVKSRVIYFPLTMPKMELNIPRSDVLHIVWPHRWEHDKNPDLFFEVLFRLKDNNYKFMLSVLGECFSEVPEVFMKAKEKLGDHIVNWGKLEMREDYIKCLQSSHVAVSTANHEFFGVAMLEAVLNGCFPLACNRLVYPEIYPEETCWMEELVKLKNIVKELEASFRISNSIDNSLLLKCVLLETENTNLKKVINDKNITFNHLFWKSQLFPFKNGCYMAMNKNYESREAHKATVTGRDKIYADEAKMKMNKLQETINKLEAELKDREKTVELLCEKYLYLKSNKNKMEINLKRKICRQERLLNVTFAVLQELQLNLEAKIERYLSKTKNMYETLFLQEKWRCNKLLYENVRLLHEIKRLEDGHVKSLVDACVE